MRTKTEMSLGKETRLFISLDPSTMKSYCVLSLDLDYDILYSRHYENTGDGRTLSSSIQSKKVIYGHCNCSVYYTYCQKLYKVF